MSTGTSSDPIIVESWAEFEEYNTVDNIGTYIQFKNNRQNNQKYDLSKSYPHGLTSGLTVYPNILGNNVHWARLCFLGENASMTAIKFMGTVDSLYIDGVYAKNIATFLHPSAKLTDVRVTAEIENGAYDLNVFGESNTQTTLDFEECEFDIHAKTKRSIYVNAASSLNTMYLTNTDIHVNFALSNDYHLAFAQFYAIDMTSSRIRGRVKVDGNDGRILLAMWQHYPYNNTQSLWDVKANASTVRFSETQTGDTLYYNTDKTTFETTPTNWIGLTTAQLQSEVALEAAGFPIGGDSPWRLTAQGVLYNDELVEIDLLGAFGGNVIYAVNAKESDKSVLPPASLQSVGEYSFAHLSGVNQIVLPSTCTYYATSFAGNTHITGGILIE